MSEEHRPLHNGNIAHTVNALQPFGLWGSTGQGQVLAQVYHYDQLNRLRAARAYTGLGVSNTWDGVADAVANRYRSAYEYDANGNITGAARFDGSGNWYDWLHYKYQKNGDRLRRNRLYQLNDLADQANTYVNETGGAQDIGWTDDLPFDEEDPDMNTAYNYSYDALGNLVRDDREHIEAIEWTVAGKVKAVDHATGEGPDLAFAYGASGQRIMKQVGVPGTDAGAYREHYIRDAQGNIMATYRYTNTGPASLKLNERPLYGSSRLGSLRKEEELRSLPSFDPEEPNTVQQVDLNYELTDHLGNVCAVVTGRLLDGNGGGTPKQAELLSAQGYEPFGSLLPGRNYNSGSTRYGFNGKENDNEVYGSQGTFQDYGFRMYDTRLARFISIDPLTREYPHYSPYIFAGASPIAFIDFDGLERVAAITFNGDVNYRADHLELMNADEITRKTLTTNPAGQMVEAFREASAADVNGIGFVAIWGHGTRNDQWGSASNSSNMVQDDLDQLEAAVANGDIRFAPNATIYIGNCNAGTLDEHGNSFAQRMADITGARVIAGSTDDYIRDHAGSVGVKDESNGNMQYSMWSPRLDNFRLFESGQQPTDLGGTIDLRPMLDRAKTMPVERMEPIAPSLDRAPTERTPVGR